MNNDAVAVLSLVSVVAAAILLFPVMRAWARRLSGDTLELETTREVAELRERMAELEVVAGRVADLEDRVDFAERLLAQRGDAPQLPLQRTPV